MLPVRVRECKPEGLLGPLVYVDLVGCKNRAEARERLLAGVGRERAKPRLEPELELLAPASLSVVNFRYRPTDRKLDDAALDALNTRISEAVSESGEAHLPNSRVRGKTSLRACFLHYENDEGDVDHLVRLVKRLGSEHAA